MKHRLHPSILSLLLAALTLATSGCSESGPLSAWLPYQDSGKSPLPTPPVSKWNPESLEAKFNLADNEWFLPMPELEVPAAASLSQPIKIPFIYQPECGEQRFEVWVDEPAKQVYVAHITSDKPAICGGIVMPPRRTERSFTPQVTGTYRVTTVISSHSYAVDVQ